MKKFWICYVEGRSLPESFKRHPTYQDAVIEAERLACLPGNIGKNVFVLGIESFCRVEPKVGLPHTAIEYAINEDGSRGYSWNWLTGCDNGPDICAVRNTTAGCWSEKLAHRFHQDFTPQFHENIFNLRFPRKPGARILVCFTGDISYATKKERFLASEMMWQAKEHSFLLLTKRPREAYLDLTSWPHNAWLGVSLTGAETKERQRQVMAELRAVKGEHKRWVSYEPTLGPLQVSLEGISWLVMGSQTGKGAVKPDAFWIPHDTIHIRHWFKNNLPDSWYPAGPRVQELPNA